MNYALDQIRTIVSNHLGVEQSELVPETRLVDDLHGDSLDAITLQMAIEQAFSTEIPDDAWHDIQTVGDVVSLVEVRAGDERG